MKPTKPMSRLAEGTYAITAASNAPDGLTMFVSCGVACAKDSVIVNAQAWGTGDTQLQVCALLRLDLAN